MVNIDDIPDFPGLPGQTPKPGDPPTVSPVAVVLVSAPLDREYRNVALNTAAVDAYIAAEIAAGRARQINVERWSPWSALHVQLPMQDAVVYNYARMTIGGRSWYGFLDAEYLNLTDTAYQVTPDVWTTYAPTIGYSNIVRGHVAVAASQSDTYGDQYLNEPEPIDAPPTTGILSANVGGSESESWTVVVISANDLRGEPFALHTNFDLIAAAGNTASSATVDSDGVVQVDVPDSRYPWSSGSVPGAGPIVYVPKVWPSPASSIDGVAAGGGVYLFTVDGFAQYLTIMQGAPWVLSGISDIRLVPSWSVPAGGGAGYTPATPPTDPLSGAWAAAAGIPNFVAKLTTSTTSGSVLAGWRDTVLGTYGSIWRKLITSQFTRIVIGNGNGYQEYLPEQWRTPGIGYQLVTGATHGEGSLRLIPQGYNLLGDHLGTEVGVGGVGGRVASGFGLAASNPASTDMSPYLAARSSASAHAAALANKGLAQSLGYTQIQLNAGVQGLQTVLGAGSGAAMGALGGNAVAGAAGSAITAIPALATAQIQASNAITMLDAAQDGSFDITAVQLGLSGLATVDAFDAWYQSLSSVSGMGNAERLSSAWRAVIGQAFKVAISVPSVDRIRALISEWSRYGYMVGRSFKPGRLDPMDHWSYWQTADTTVLGSMPQADRDTIARAFERGVTVWTSVAEIGTTPNNQPRSGIAY